jgi:PAS domain S-box-containing protein
MTKNKRPAAETADLRHRAEELLIGNTEAMLPPRTDEEMLRIHHELQIELEMQNAELRQTRDEVETVLEKYTDLYDFAPVGYFTLDRDGVIRGANFTGSTLLGIERSQLIGRCFGKFVLPEDRPTFITFLGKVFASWDKEACEVAIKRDGKRPLHLQIEAVASSSAAECRVAVIDITARREAERLRKSDRQFAEAQSIAHIGSWEWDTIADEISGSDEFRRIYGMILSSYDSFLQRVHADDREMVNNAVQETLSLQAPYDVHFRIIRPDGITRVIHAQGSAITDGAGKTVRMIGTNQDVTERKQLEAEIQDAREYAENIVETVREPLVVLNSDLKILTANLSFYDTFKVTPEETIGNFIYDLGNRQWDIPKLRVLFEKILPHDTVFNSYEVEHDFLDIGHKIILLNARQIFRENIGSRIILLAMEDITERKLAEAALEILHAKLAAHAVELESANIELEAFNYMVAHDLRTPLSNIHGFCQVVQQFCAGDNEDCNKYIKEIYEATERMDRLIDTLLKFSRTIRVEMRHDTVDLSEMARGVAASLERTEPERRVTFRIAEGIKVNGDTGLLHIVLDNLIGNAWKYSGNREGTVIEFGVKEIEGKPVCFVRDNGPGFDMADAEKLFIPFQRLPGMDEFKGHGIGLATVERIIRRHGGKVRAEGEPGKGATFYFTLLADRSAP